MARTNLKVVDPRSPQREALASAIANVAQAEDDLRVAREAVDKARERPLDAQDRLAALQEQHAGATHNHATAFLAAIQDGREPSVEEIEGPAKSREAEEAEVLREIETLAKTRAALDEVIPAREKALATAKSKLTGTVAEVIRSETDVATLLAEAEAATADLTSRRSALITLQSLLPQSEEKAAVDLFLSRLFLRPEATGEYLHHPASQAITAAREALMRDPDAALGE